MWLYGSGNDRLPPIRLYDYQPSRGGYHAEEFLKGFGLNPSSMKGYLRLYRAKTGLPPRTRGKKAGNVTQPTADQKEPRLKEYEVMLKEELIDALVMARINEARLKKAAP